MHTPIAICTSTDKSTQAKITGQEIPQNSRTVRISNNATLPLKLRINQFASLQVFYNSPNGIPLDSKAP